MDEFAVAIRLVESAAAELHRLQVGERVTHVHVRVSAACGLAREALAFSFELMAEGSALSGATLEIEECSTPVSGPHPDTELVALEVAEVRPRVVRAAPEDDEEDDEDDRLDEARDAVVQEG